MEVTIKSIVKDKNEKIVETPNGVLCTVDIKGEEQMIVLPREQLTGMLPDDENDEIQTDSNTTGERSTDKIEWGQEDTRLLLRLYAKYLRNVGPSKQFRCKRLMWSKIADDIFEQTKLKRTWIQCENRYKTILKRKATLQTFSRAKRRRVHDDELNKTIEEIHKAEALKTEEFKSDMITDIVTKQKRRSKYDIDPMWVVDDPSENENVKKVKAVNETKIKHKKDVFGVFGKYIASKLRTMKFHKNRLIAQHKIQELLFKIEMEDYEEFKLCRQEVNNKASSSSADNTIRLLPDIIED